MSILSIDDFSLLGVLGKGTYGKILLVRKNDTEEVLALKTVKKQRLSRRSQIERVTTERTILEEVNHPFIIKLKYAFQSNEKLYLVIEYCPGGELINYLSRRMEEPKVKFYAGCIVLAIEYLHSKNIIYRDLKPENLLIDKRGYLKLTDFGLSKQTTKLNTFTMIETTEYTAPEMVRETGHGRASDWWSFGCLLYELLVGHPPFRDQDERILSHKILNDEVFYPEFLSYEARNLLKGCLLYTSPSPRDS